MRPGVVVQLHRQADDLVPLAREQRRGHGGIDAAGHGDDDTHLCCQDADSMARWLRTVAIATLALPASASLAQSCHRICSYRRARELRSFSTARQLLEQVVDLRVGVAGAEAEADRVLRAVRGQAHRAQDVRGLERARRAGGAGRHRDAFEIERDQQRLRFDRSKLMLVVFGHPRVAARR